MCLLKAMNLLYRLRDVEYASKENRRISPLRAWLCSHAMSSLDKYQQLEITGFDSPLIFQAETPMRRIIAYIDSENKFTTEDKLSQVIHLDIFTLCITIGRWCPYRRNASTLCLRKSFLYFRYRVCFEFANDHIHFYVERSCLYFSSRHLYFIPSFKLANSGPRGRPKVIQKGHVS